VTQAAARVNTKFQPVPETDAGRIIWGIPHYGSSIMGYAHIAADLNGA
jgi:hypothetical protein